MAKAKTNALTTAINIFASPREAFASIREKPTVLIPYLLLVVVSATANWLYLLEVDIGWLTEQQIRGQQFFELPEAQIEQAVNAAVDRGRTFNISISVISVFVLLAVIMLIQALYLRIVSKFRKDGVDYMHWFSLVAWTSLPTVLVSVATIVFILANDVTFVDQAGINPLSFANLLAMDLSDVAGFVRGVLNYLSPLNVWSLVLVILGYRDLSKCGIGTAATVVIVPILFIIAIIAALL